MKRPLSEAERKLIAKRRPWFGSGRREANEDLASNEADVFEFAVRRFWDVNECGPPCCPRAFLIETVAGELIYLESWTALPPSDAVGRDCAAHRTTRSKTLLLFETSGPVMPVQQGRDLLFDFEAPECEWVRIEDLPVAVQQAIRSSPPDDAQGEDRLLPVP
ncbi:MAG TPA: hypothetical protein VGF69_20070 [Thermoanaerobaculia bacterium]|jgi:hypothetical protein